MSEGIPQDRAETAKEAMAALMDEGFVLVPIAWRTAARRVLPEPEVIREGLSGHLDTQGMPSGKQAPWVRWPNGIPFSFVVQFAEERGIHYRNSGLFMNGVWRISSLRWCLDHPEIVGGRHALERMK